MKKLLLVLALLMPACIVEERVVVQTPDVEEHVQVVREEPPPQRVEVRPTQPHHSHVWVGGRWVHGPRGYSWVPGRWVSAKGRAWVPGSWVRVGIEWHYWPGHWRQ